MVDKENESERSQDYVSDQEKEHAQNALNEFSKANYVGCLQNLSKLDSRITDIKVAHNRIVVEYYKSDLKKTEPFRKNLTALCHQFKIRLDALDDVDHCAVHYNQALLLYHNCQYTAALRIMDRVYKFIEPMEETLARQASLLLIELYLSTRQVNKALAMITYAENQLINNFQKENKNTKEVKNKKVPTVVTESTPEKDIFKVKLMRYRARCYLLSHNLPIAKDVIKSLLPSDNSENKILTTCLKANLEYLQGNHKEAMKILSSISTNHLVYSDCGESSTVLFYNNMGILHHAMGKPHLACHYFQKALKEDIQVSTSPKSESPTENSNGRPLHTLGGSRYHEIIYNLGIALLYAGRPIQAFDCLTIAVKRYHRNSRLWLRLAECCIAAHKASNETDFDIQKRQKDLVVGIVGNKDNKKVILTTNLSSDKEYSVDSQLYAVPVATLEFASLCLRNAFLLLPSETAASPVPLLLIPGVTPPAPPPSPGPAPSAPLSPNDIVSLRNAVLVANAYVSLCLGDYMLTLEYAENLLTQTQISGAHRLLAHLYAAEALVLLDRISDAIDHLNPDLIKNIELETPADDSDNDLILINTMPPTKWFPENVATALAVIQYNLAVAKSIRGQLDQAASLLKHIKQSRTSNARIPAHVMMLELYIELKLGHADVARSLIKQYSLQLRMSC